AAVLMIVLARPELLDRRPNWGGGRLNHLAIALEPLASNDIADLVRHLLDTDQPDLVELVSKRSEGNPFYASELVRSYLEHGTLGRAERGRARGRAGRDPGVPLPRSRCPLHGARTDQRHHARDPRTGGQVAAEGGGHRGRGRRDARGCAAHPRVLRLLGTEPS